MRKLLHCESLSLYEYLLQCGRIYKDAEIRSSSPAAHGRVSSGFNVAASIKMRKCGGSIARASSLTCFNVAASIKMRKLEAPEGARLQSIALQCGRIYKDAEIHNRKCFARPKVWLQCGRIYKDAEIGKTTVFRREGFARLQCGRIYKDAEIKVHGRYCEFPRIASMWPHL